MQAGKSLCHINLKRSAFSERFSSWAASQSENLSSCSIISSLNCIFGCVPICRYTYSMDLVPMVSRNHGFGYHGCVRPCIWFPWLRAAMNLVAIAARNWYPWVQNKMFLEYLVLLKIFEIFMCFEKFRKIRIQEI